MSPLRRVIQFMNIQPGEERLVGLLVLLNFLLSMSYTFIQSMAFGVFLAEYGPQNLPFSYIAIAIFASLAALLYIKVGDRVSFPRLLKLDLVFLGLISLLSWLGLVSPAAHSVAFILPSLFNVVVNLENLVIWPLAGRLFSFGQAKRLFPLLSVGLWVAYIFGGLLVSPLVAWIGAYHLLLLAVGCIALSFVVLNYIHKTEYHRAAALDAAGQPAGGGPKKPESIFKNSYVLLIFASVAIWWIAFFFVDNLYSDRASVQFPDVNQLTAFMGQLLSFTGVVALFSSLYLSGRIISRLGLRAGLFALPLVLTLTVSLLGLSGGLGAPLAITFGLGVLSKILFLALGFSLSQSSNAIVYQSLPDAIRRRVQALADGVVNPIAIGISGFLLLLLTSVFHLNYVGIALVFLGLAAAWLMVIHFVGKAYVRALTQAITHHRLGESPLSVADAAGLAVLRAHLLDPHPDVAIYALNKLLETAPQAAADALPALLRHPAPEVRREVYCQVERQANASVQEIILEQLSREQQPEVREAGLRALAAAGRSSAIPQLQAALNAPDRASRRGALAGLLKYGSSPARQAAEQALAGLLASPQPDDRALAAQVLGQLDASQYLPACQALLQDASPVVRRAALQAAGQSRRIQLIPALISACDDPAASRAASQALKELGPEVLTEVEAAFNQPDAPRQRLLILSSLLGNFGGVRAGQALSRRMLAPDGQLRGQIYSALSKCSFRFSHPKELRAALTHEINLAARANQALVGLEQTPSAVLLAAALKLELAQARERILLLLSFAFDQQALLRAREALRTGSPAQKAYVLEVIDTQLPAEWRPLVLPLMEDSDGRAEPPLELEHADGKSLTGQLCAVISPAEDTQFSTWVRACAIYTATRQAALPCLDAIRQAALEPDPLLKTTAEWSLVRLVPEENKGNHAMLSTIEKVLILKSVSMFGQTPDNVLADVANLIEECEVSAGETIFRQGEPGDSLYVVIEGRVKVHIGDQELNQLGERDVFGEMALLDPEPRLASVTALEQTRLFRLDQAPFYELLAERPEIAGGIIRVLTRHLRNRVQDMAELSSRNRELERILQ